MTYDENLNPVITQDLKEAWNKAVDLDYLRRHSPKEHPKWRNLRVVDINMEAYGDRKLYEDVTTGIYYCEYYSIGD